MGGQRSCGKTADLSWTPSISGITWGPRGIEPDAGRPLSLAETDWIGRAFVVVTPEYNHGYPAPLKSLIDSVGREWQAKPVAFVSYGGVSGGLRAVEQLRQVFAKLHMVTNAMPSVSPGLGTVDAMGGCSSGAATSRHGDNAHWAALVGVALRDARAVGPLCCGQPERQKSLNGRE